MGLLVLLSLSGCGVDSPIRSTSQDSRREIALGNDNEFLAGETRETDLESASEQVLLKKEAKLSENFDPAIHGEIAGTYSDGVYSGRYKWVVNARKRPARPGEWAAKEGGGTVASPRAVISPVLRAQMTEQAEGIPVIITLKEALATDLEPEQTVGQKATLQDGEDRDAFKATLQARVALRKAEASEHQREAKAKLREDTGVDLSGAGEFWIVNALSAELTGEEIESLALSPDVEDIAYDTPLTEDWTGQDISSSSYFNGGAYLNSSPYYHDGDVSNPVTGNSALTVAILDAGFNRTHPVFLDAMNPASTRIKSTWNCINTPCSFGGATGSGQHGTGVAAAAAADGTDEQISGTNAYQENRSGVAREAAIIMILRGSLSSLVRGLEKAVDLGVDVINESAGGASPCDGNAGAWDEAVFNAESAGVLVTGSAGNIGDASTCTLSEAATVPSVLTVGNVSDPGSSSYGTAGLASSSSTGPVTAVVNGVTRTFTGVDVAVVGRTQYAADSGSLYADVNGTSFAAPKIAGAGILFRDYAIEMGWASYSHSPAWLRANLIAMTDRWDGSTYRNAGFHKRWGGGRFQMRKYTIEDHPTGLWRWETGTYTLSDGQVVEHNIGGSGTEPSGLQMVKAYVTTREVNGDDVADIDIRLRTNNCDGTTLRIDDSYDSKSMVRAGSEAAGEKLCVSIFGAHVPAGQQRTVQLVVYYSDETEMR